MNILASFRSQVVRVGMAATFAFVSMVPATAAFAQEDAGSLSDTAIASCELPEANNGIGTGTIGYWKNHAKAWPVDVIEMGAEDYEKADAIKIMKLDGRRDKAIDLYAQLAAAKLNVRIGASSDCIVEDIVAADEWLAEHGIGNKISADSAEWKAIEDTFERLDAYNNGELCAVHRDDNDALEGRALRAAMAEFEAELFETLDAVYASLADLDAAHSIEVLFEEDCTPVKAPLESIAG